jgi:serine/threonine protein kinase
MTEPQESRNPVEELAEEFLARYRRGERPALSEYTGRRPELAEEIREAFAALVMLEEARPLPAARPAAFQGKVTADGRTPHRLGDYRILREIGRGGMGVVYEAVQEALGRHVALKVLPYDAATDSTCLKRFVREARAAARLHHTNIAPVYDVGEHEGVHYYTMQFIEGHGLDHVLTELRHLRSPDRPLGPAASLADSLLTGRFAVPNASAGNEPLKVELSPDGSRLPAADATPAPVANSQSLSDLSTQSPSPYFRSVARIGLQVAEALAYAHDQKLLHRDIKPANLILDIHGITWVTDFGLAKQEGEDLTRAGDVVGTLRYMAPERFSGCSDGRSDLYSVGLTLYELLTLQPAFADTDRGRLIRRITHEEPIAPRKHDRRVPRDLETIVLKAAAKEPQRRYACAQDLAEDLRRFLADRPVLARRTPWTGHVWCWVRRNPGWAATLAAVAGLLLVMAVGGLVLNLRLQGALTEARAAAAAEKTATAAAKAREAEARAVLQFVQDKVLAAARPKGEIGGLGQDVKLRQAVEAALPYLDKSFADQPLIEAQLRVTLGNSFMYLGEPNTAAAQFAAARAIFARNDPDHPDMLWSMNNLANAYAALGQNNDALALHQETLARRRRQLGPEHPDTLLSMNNVAVAYYDFDRPADALKLLDETLDLQKTRLGPDHPETLRAMHNLARCYYALGRFDDALKLHQNTLARRRIRLGPNQADTLHSMYALALTYSALHQYPSAAKFHEESLARRQATLGPDHPDTLRSMTALAEIHYELAQYPEALRLYQDTLAREKAALGRDDPKTLWTMRNLALTQSALGRHADALMAYQETLALQRARFGPDDRVTIWLMADVAKSLKKLDRRAEARPVMQEAAERWEKLNPTDPVRLYNAACFRALSAALSRTEAKTSGSWKPATAEDDQAMKWLQRAVAAGFDDAAHMKQDRDLDALRDREDFKKLVAGLEARQKKPGPNGR